MNKTVSIHIQGFAFLLEEQAYDLLRKYLTDLAAILQNEEGKEEILQDIELRIVELLQEKSSTQQVVQLEQIQAIIQVLGSPEEFGESDQNASAQDTAQNASVSNADKRFFRDTDNAILGGVASGVAAYFNIDVVFIRVAFVLFTMVFGSGVPIYLLLWIITPVAKTASEKLQMKGRPVNVESIKTEFKEAADRVEGKAKRWTKQLRNGSGLSQSAKRFVDFLSKAVGVILIFWGLAVLVSASIFLFVDPKLIPAQINGEFTSLGELSALFFETGQINDFIYTGVALLAFSVALSSMLIGFRLLLSFQGKWFRAILGVFSAASVVGIILLIVAGVSTAKSFAIDGGMSAELKAYNGDSLQLNISNDFHLAAFNQQKVQLKVGVFKPSRNPGQGLILAENGRVYNSGIAIEYSSSKDSSYHIRIEKKANGSSYLKANLRASHIYFPCRLKDGKLELSSGFSFPAKDRLRDQEVVLHIEVPTGKVVLHNDKVVYPYFTEEEPDQASDRAYVSGDGEYSAW
jgi:phage shock protein PspC (stress-responsive transcriptional regulator)